jgi:hypothetical protein
MGEATHVGREECAAATLDRHDGQPPTAAVSWAQQRVPQRLFW